MSKQQKSNKEAKKPKKQPDGSVEQKKGSKRDDSQEHRKLS